MKQNARGLGAVVHNVAAAPAVINGSCASFAPVFQKGALARPCYLSGAGYAVTSPGLCRALSLPPHKARGWRAKRRVIGSWSHLLAKVWRLSARHRDVHTTPGRAF